MPSIRAVIMALPLLVSAAVALPPAALFKRQDCAVPSAYCDPTPVGLCEFCCDPAHETTIDDPPYYCHPEHDEKMKRRQEECSTPGYEVYHCQDHTARK